MKNYFIIALLFCANFFYAQTEGAGKYAAKNIDTNTSKYEFGTAFHSEDKLVFAAPRRGFRIIRDVWEENGQRFLDLYEGTISEGGNLTNVKKLGGEVNSKYHEADAVFTKDNKTVFFTRDNYYNKKLGFDNKGITNLAMFKASINAKGEWINIIPMPFNNVEYSVGHPALSEDEKTLYFVSDMPGSLGEVDIFKVEINQSGFGNPENLGSKVNSTAKDWFPFVDGQVLYFASDRAGGKGGSDIYATKLAGIVTNPINLNEPVNSAGDDIAFIINAETRKGYFSSNREGGQGDDDIYSFTEEESIVFKCIQIIKGEVRDLNSEALLPGAEVVLKDAEGNEIETVLTKDDATFSFEINCETEYKLMGRKVDYTPQSKTFTTSNEPDIEKKLIISLGRGSINFMAGGSGVNGNGTSQDQRADVKPEGLPDKLPEQIVKLQSSGQYAVNINPIYFELNSSYLNKAAKRELKKVAKLMKEYPEMIIEAASHTDSRAPDSWNNWLSDNRAKRTVKYIIRQGINPRRITGKGYGETQLINECANGVQCTEAQHAKNRRSDFVIIRM